MRGGHRLQLEGREQNLQEDRMRGEVKERRRRKEDKDTSTSIDSYSIVAIHRRASHHRRAIMVVTSLVLSIASSLSLVVASLPFYISEAVRVYERTSHLASHVQWDIPWYIIGNISHRVVAGTASIASEEVIMVADAAQPASPPQAQHSRNSQHIHSRNTFHSNSLKYVHPLRNRGTSRHILSRTSSRAARRDL